MIDYMEIGYGGWYMPSRRPKLGGFFARYDVTKQEKSSESQSRSFLPIQEKGLTQTLRAFLDQGRIGAGQEQFPGERVAGFVPGQVQAIEGVPQFLDTFAAQRELPFFGETGGALRGVLSGELGGDILSPERAEEIFQATRVAPRTRQFERFDKPIIEEQFAGPGFQSTARAQAVTRGAEELGRDIASEREQFMFGVEQANRGLQEARAGRSLAAIPLGAELATLPEQVAATRLAGRGGVFDFLTAQQQQRQREISAERETFQEAQRFMDPEDFSNLMALLGLTFQQSTSESFFESPLSAGMKSFFGAAGGAAGGNIGVKATGGTRL